MYIMHDGPKVKCSKCGSTDVFSRMFMRAEGLPWTQYHCGKCGHTSEPPKEMDPTMRKSWESVSNPPDVVF